MQFEGRILFDFAESVNNKWSVLPQIPQQVEDGQIWLGQFRDDLKVDTTEVELLDIWLGLERVWYVEQLG